MKILHAIPSLAREHGGPSRALALMEQALAAQGVEVETATTDDDGPGRRNGRTLGSRLEEDGALRWYFGKALDAYKVSPSFARWINDEVNRYDIVHIHALFSHTSVAAARAARRHGVPYVIRPLGTLGDYGLTQRRPWLKSLSLRFVEGPLLRDAAAIHFTSLDEAAEARKLGIAMREAVIPLAVEVPAGDAAAGAMRANGDAPVVLLFLSRIDAKKNIEGLLDAFAQLQRERGGLRLDIAGGGEAGYVVRLQERAQSLGVHTAVRWLGHVEGEAKAATFSSAHAFVLPSFSENFAIAAAEALAHGLPCVLGEGVAIAREVAQANAGFVVATDAQSIAQGLRLIISDERNRRSMASSAAQLARERYSMQAMGAGLKQLYTEILTR